VASLSNPVNGDRTRPRSPTQPQRCVLGVCPPTTPQPSDPGLVRTETWRQRAHVESEHLREHGGATAHGAVLFQMGPPRQRRRRRRSKEADRTDAQRAQVARVAGARRQDRAPLRRVRSALSEAGQNTSGAPHHRGAVRGGQRPRHGSDQHLPLQRDHRLLHPVQLGAAQPRAGRPAVRDAQGDGERAALFGARLAPREDGCAAAHGGHQHARGVPARRQCDDVLREALHAVHLRIGQGADDGTIARTLTRASSSAQRV
jgi:hypothetical protein